MYIISMHIDMNTMYYDTMKYNLMFNIYIYIDIDTYIFIYTHTCIHIVSQICISMYFGICMWYTIWLFNIAMEAMIHL